MENHETRPCAGSNNESIKAGSIHGFGYFKKGEFVQNKAIKGKIGGICPWCGTDGLSLADKLTLGPFSPKKCGHCQHAVRASWSSALTTTALLLVPFIGSLVYGGSVQFQGVESTLIAAAGLLAGGALSLAWQRQYLRLVRHGGADPSPQL